MDLARNMGRHNRKWLWLAVSVAACAALCGCFGHKNTAAATTGTSAEPDKVLFDNAMNDIQHDRFDVGRLALQTLINTYPDSEYLAKAKLAVADSYYKEGGESGLTQAVAEYQDFITFFPFLDEAAYAQMQVGMAHYRRMEKPDRDRDEALEAEGAFQTFLQKYPSSPLYKDAQQRLRDVQEVLAEGDFRIAQFYYIRKADRAAVARLSALVTRYPLYSQADRANFMLATIYDRTEHADVATQFYAKIVKEYPLSPLADEAKAKLVKFGTPVPQPDPEAMARMQAEQQTPRPQNKLMTRPLAALKSAPDVRMAARTGSPTLAPEDNGTTDTLVPGGAGNTIVGSATAGGENRATNSSSGNGGNNNSTPSVEAETVGSSATAPLASPTATEVVVTQPTAGSAGTQSVAAAGGSAVQGADGSAATAGDPASTTPAADGSTATTPAATTTTKNGKESSSKKKKGFLKIIP